MAVDDHRALSRLHNPNKIAISTESKNSLYSEVEGRDLLKPIGPRKNESAPDTPVYAVLEGPDPDNKARRSQSSEYALPVCNNICQDSQKEPLYNVLETSNPSHDPDFSEPHLYDVPERYRKDIEGSIEC